MQVVPVEQQHAWEAITAGAAGMCIMAALLTNGCIRSPVQATRAELRRDWDVVTDRRCLADLKAQASALGWAPAFVFAVVFDRYPAVVGCEGRQAHPFLRSTQVLSNVPHAPARRVPSWQSCRRSAAGCSRRTRRLLRVAACGG